MISHHLPGLQVILPLLTAPICFLLWRFNRSCWLLATAVSWLCLFISIVLTLQVWDGTELQYAFGGWVPPWGIEYRVDRLNALVLLLVSAIAAVVFPYSWRSIQPEIAPPQRSLFYTSMLLCLAGLLGITIAGDAFNLFVLLEISSLASYNLISMGRDRRALTAAFQYLIMGTIGATFILIGVGILYMLTGSLNMQDIAARIADIHQSRALKAAFSFLVIGIGLKLAMFPLHLWLPNAYAYAPSAVSAFIAATATKVAVYVMLRYLYTIFGAGFSFSVMHIQWLLIPVSLIAIVFTSIVALFQHDIKRLLAYSSVAQIGYMLLGIGLTNVDGLSATLLHLVNHALMKGALFMAMGAVCYRLGNTLIENMTGIGQQMPWTMGAFAIGGLSIIGIPATAGFISKWYLITATINSGWWLVTIIILVASLLAVAYIWRVIEVAFINAPPASSPKLREAPIGLLLPTWILALSNIYFGVNPTLLIGLTNRAAITLISGQ